MGTLHRPIRIAILGAGFGGLYAYLGLHARLHKKTNVEITLISDQDYFLFVTLIHEVATGTLLPVSITQSIRTIPLCCPRRFIHGKVTAADFDNRRVSVEKQSLSFPDGRAGPSTPVSEEFSYDYLVLALGSDSKFVGTPGAREHALTLKNLKDAETIKNRMIDSFEHASRLTSADEVLYSPSAS